MVLKHRIQFRYDSRGNRVGLTAPDGGRFTYAYDAVGRIKTVENPQAQRTTFLYDPAGRRTGTLLANGTRTSTLYDAAGRITAVSNRKSDGTPQTTFEYQYDNAGNRTGVVELDGTRVTWTYDAAGRLAGEHRTGSHPYRDTFTYDPAGNRLLKIHDGARTTYAYDAANQLTTSLDAGGTTTYLFDPNGNQAVDVAPTGRTTTVWDFENRTILTVQPTSARSTMAYQAEGLRVLLHEPGDQKLFLWDPNTAAYLLEKNPGGATTALYTHEPIPYGSLLSHRKSGATAWYHFDALGSTRTLTDVAQALLETYGYGAWGEILATPTLLTPFLWVGRVGYYCERLLQAYYIRARMYLLRVDRWLTADPLRILQSLSLYSYSSDLPIISIDPSGLAGLPVCYYLIDGGRYCEPGPISRDRTVSPGCEVIVRCWPVVRLGITIGTHCGVTVNRDIRRGRYGRQIDGEPQGYYGPWPSGCIQIGTDEDPSTKGAVTKSVVYSGNDPTMCDCIDRYVAEFNAENRGGGCVDYNAIGGDNRSQCTSKFALKCIAHKCSFGISFPALGLPTPPAGYDCLQCIAWTTIGGVDFDGGPYCICTDWEPLPCP